MRRSSPSNRGISSFKHSFSPAPQRSSKSVVGDEPGEAIFFRAGWCLSVEYIANKGATDAFTSGPPCGRLHENAPDLTKGLTSPAQARQFVEATGIDILAPAVGNMHGMLKSMVQGKTRKHLDIPRIAQIKSATGALLTLHGGSGTDDEDLRKAIAAGINVVHINTELRVAWRRGLEQGLAKLPDEVVPYKIFPPAVEAVKQVVLSRLRVFTGKRKAA